MLYRSDFYKVRSAFVGDVASTLQDVTKGCYGSIRISHSRWIDDIISSLV